MIYSYNIRVSYKISYKEKMLWNKDEFINITQGE